MPPRSDADPALARALRELRTERGMTREELAHGSNLTLNTIAKLEQGKTNPTWSTIRRLAAALGTPVVDVVARAERLRDSG